MLEEESLNPLAKIYSVFLSLSLPYNAVWASLRNWPSLPGKGNFFHDNKENVIPYSGDRVSFLAFQDGGLLPSLSFCSVPSCCLFYLSSTFQSWHLGGAIMWRETLASSNWGQNFTTSQLVSQCKLFGFAELHSLVLKEDNNTNCARLLGKLQANVKRHSQ